jgi:hypothetical protein
MKITSNFSQLLKAILLCTLTQAHSKEILFQESFSGAEDAPLNGSAPDVSRDSIVWVATPEYRANGSAVAGALTRHAYLNMGDLIDGNRGNPDALYTLTATIDVSPGTSTYWEGLGFWNEGAPEYNFASLSSRGTGWMLRRDNNQIRVFRGPKTANGIAESNIPPNSVPGSVDFKIVLDLTDWNGTDNWGDVSYFAKIAGGVDYTEIAAGELDATSSTFQAVGIGGGAVAAQIKSFELWKSGVSNPGLPSLRLAELDHDSITGKTEVRIIGKPATRYELTEDADLNFSESNRQLVPLTGAVTGTLEGSKVLTDAAGEAQVSFQLPIEKSTAFIRAEVAQPAEPKYYLPAPAVDSVTLDYEVGVYGGSPAGVGAALQAVRMGKRTILLSFNNHVGGLTSGGLTATDIGDPNSIGGLAATFYERIGRTKGFKPSEAETLFRTMLQEEGVTVLFGRCLSSVTMNENELVSMTMETGETIRAQMFIDGTYEGDLMAAANVSYRVGREPRGAFDESLAGQFQTESWAGVYQFAGLPISPYVIAGDANSGLLPEISANPAGAPGEGDYRVQAYNFRMHLTNSGAGIPFPQPPQYDAGRFDLLARFMEYDANLNWTLNYTTAPLSDGPVQMQNGDSNNAGSFSSDYVGGADQWPDGTFSPVSFSTLPAPRRGLPLPLNELYQLREEIFQDHVRYQQGLLYFLANDPRVPSALQQRVNQFGLAPGEFKETKNWPHQLYVREARRMVSDYIMTQANCESTRTAEDSIGLASYPMDSHFCQRVPVMENGVMVVRNEGGFGKPCPSAYPVSYRSIVPKVDECTNLLVPLCLSSSHVAYGSIRMEPVFMILGQSAGTAAAMAIDNQGTVQGVDYDILKARLIDDGQKL